MELEEEEVPAHSADNARKALLETLGVERRDRVLATLYIVRQDTVGIVRQASIHIWKALVQSQPKVLLFIIMLIMIVRHAPHNARDLACPHATPHVAPWKPSNRSAGGA